MTFPRLVGVSGFLRTGKDSVAALLQTFGYARLAFADPLRKLARDIDPYIDLRDAPRDICDDVDHDADNEGPVLYSVLFDTVGYERAKEVPDFRRFLQRLGTEGIRGNFGEDAWVNLAVQAIEALPHDTNVVLPDVRFPNEAAAIRRLGGVVWRTERPGFGAGEHPSEAMVLRIVPDAVLRAATLLDVQGEHGKSRGLGSLVLDQLGLEGDYDLTSWAEAILTA